MATPANHPVSPPAARGRALGVIAATWLGAGCGGGSTGGPGLRPTPPPTPTEDLTIDLPTSTLQGTLFLPEALPTPPMVAVRPSRKTTLDKQRAAWKKVATDAKAPLARRTLEAQVLATLLSDRIAALPPEAATRGPLLAEARAALAALHDVAGDKIDRTTLEMAAALALADGDGAAAAPYLDELLTRFPDAPAAAMARAQLAFIQLVAGKDAAAAAVVAGVEPTAARPDLAYVVAWVRFRAGDGPGAATAIAAAAAGWQDVATRPGLIRDYLIMTARGAVAPTVAADGLAALIPDGPARAAALLDLARAYDLGGRPDEADAAITVALDRGGAALPAADQLAARRLQAETVRRAGRLDQLGDRWREVAAALARCADCGDDVRRAVGTELAQRAYELHTIHVTSGDARARTAAAALYRVHAGLAGGDPAVAAHARELESVRVPDDGSQYHEAVRAPLIARFQEVLACYEGRLQGERTLGGALTVRLEVDQRGAVTGVTTEPAGGMTGMAAVASCVEGRARAWTLPSRPRPGVARISLPFVLGALT